MQLKQMNRDFSRLCPAARFYLVTSVISLLLIGLENAENNKKFCVAGYGCDVSRTGNMMIFVINAIMILFHTWVLDLICKAGYKQLSWVLVLLPFILFIMIMVLLVLNNIMRKL